MKKAILIQCHKDAAQINRLIRSLRSEQHTVDIYIHVDAKSDIANCIDKTHNTLFAEKRIDVRWGTFSQIEATLELLKMTAGKGYDHISLISGQDFPTTSIDRFCTFLEAHQGQSFVDYHPLPNSMWAHNGGIGRVKYRWCDYLIPRKDRLSRLIKQIHLTFYGKIFTKNIAHLGQLYGGSGWFTITGDAAEYILKYLKNNPNYLTTYRHSYCCDEIFFQTLLLNSPLASTINNNNLRFIKWAKEARNPDILTAEHLPEITASESFFMRKVAPDTSAKLMEMINIA